MTVWSASGVCLRRDAVFSDSESDSESDQKRKKKILKEKRKEVMRLAGPSCIQGYQTASEKTSPHPRGWRKLPPRGFENRQRCRVWGGKVHRGSCLRAWLKDLRKGK